MGHNEVVFSTFHTISDHVVLCLARVHSSDAEDHTPDEIQVHISSQDSDDETFCNPPENRSRKDSDAEDSRENPGLKSLRFPRGEYLSLAESDDDNMLYQPSTDRDMPEC